jgi:chitin synthase
MPSPEYRVPLTVVKFVLALGNRPKGERTAYVITLWCVPLMSSLRAAEKINTRVYAVLAVYLLVCSLSLTVKAFAVSCWNYSTKPEV